MYVWYTHVCTHVHCMYTCMHTPYKNMYIVHVYIFNIFDKYTASYTYIVIMYIHVHELYIHTCTYMYMYLKMYMYRHVILHTSKLYYSRSFYVCTCTCTCTCM